jgi:hypothetical protein
MKTLLTTLIIVLALAGSAHAAPFLVCTPYTGTTPDYFMVSFDGGAATQTPVYAVTSPTGVEAHVDLASVPTGSHTATLQACSTLWGCSAASASFPFTKALPSVPTGTGISPN